MAIQISGCTVIDNSRDSINIRDSRAQDFRYVLSGACTQLGSPIGGYLGGNLICKALSVGWIVASCISECRTNWYLRNDANTAAQSDSGYTGWFVPTISQLQNPGRTCRIYWDTYYSSGYQYWSSTESNATHACVVNFGSGVAYCRCKTLPSYTRAFRCVTY